MAIYELVHIYDVGKVKGTYDQPCLLMLYAYVFMTE